MPEQIEPGTPAAKALLQGAKSIAIMRAINELTTQHKDWIAKRAKELIPTVAEELLAEANRGS